MQYIKIQQEYLDYLQKREERIPNQNYGQGHYKPFYILMESEGDICYVTQLTSPKTRHQTLKNNLDFQKLYHLNSGRYLGATNLNYMFPVLPEYIEFLSLSDLKEIVHYDSVVRNLIAEKKAIEKLKLNEDAKKLYNLKYNKPDAAISKRCIDFKKMEAVLLEYKLNEQFDRNDIEVERSDDHSTFFITTSKAEYEYSEQILNDMYGFMVDINESLMYEIDQNQSNYLDV